MMQIVRAITIIMHVICVVNQISMYSLMETSSAFHPRKCKNRLYILPNPCGDRVYFSGVDRCILQKYFRHQGGKEQHVFAQKTTFCQILTKSDQKSKAAIRVILNPVLLLTRVVILKPRVHSWRYKQNLKSIPVFQKVSVLQCC